MQNHKSLHTQAHKHTEDSRINNSLTLIMTWPVSLFGAIAEGMLM